VHNPHNEELQLPEPYTPPSLTDLYGPGVTEDNLASQTKVPQYLQSKLLVGGNATLAVTYGDGSSEGFNDPALGEARRTAFEYAMSVWADDLQGPALITINATMTPRGGTSTSAVLASAAPAQLWEEFTNAPIANTFYAECLTEIISGSDPDPSTLDINIDFNSDVDNSTVLGSIDWYYGLDASPGTDIDFATVAIHELCHGLGFSDSFIGSETFGLGAFFRRSDDLRSVFSERHWHAIDLVATLTQQRYRQQRFLEWFEG
jgi:hypothetical protein